MSGCGGEGGIRTHEGLAPLPVFKTGAFNRSATSPLADGVEIYLASVKQCLPFVFALKPCQTFYHFYSKSFIQKYIARIPS